MKKEIFYITLFLLVASGLHFFYIPFPSLWIDESIAINLSYLPGNQLINNLLSYQSHPPVFHFLLKFWRFLFGDTESTAKFLSFVFFLLTVIATYFFAKELFGEKVARFSLPFSSTNHFLIFFSHQVRPYAMLAFITVASFYFFTRMLKRFDIKTLCGYLIFTVIGLYTHYWFVLAFFVQGLIALIFARRIEFKKIFGIMFLAGLSFLPWIVSYFHFYRSYYISEASPASDLTMLWQSIRFLLWGQAALIAPIVVIALFYFLSQKKPLFTGKLETAIVLMYLFVPIAFAYIISKFLPIYTPGRREILVIPALVVLCAYIFSKLNYSWWFPSISALLIIFAIQPIIVSNAMMSGFRSHDKQFLNDIFEKLNSGDAVVLLGFSAPNFDYYWRRYPKKEEKAIDRFYAPSGSDKSIIDLQEIKEIANDKNKLDGILNEIAAKIAEKKRDNLYLFLSDPRLNDPFVKFFDNRYKKDGDIVPEFPQMNTYINGVKIYSP